MKIVLELMLMHGANDCLTSRVKILVMMTFSPVAV